MSYTRGGGPVHSTLLDPSARFHVFPDDVRAELDEHFPREISASASRTVRRVCVVRDDGSVPCAD